MTKNPTYCCDFMQRQLNYDCPDCGNDCPDVIVALGKGSFSNGKLFLLGRNDVQYACNYCPWCGTRWGRTYICRFCGLDELEHKYQEAENPEMHRFVDITSTITREEIGEMLNETQEKLPELREKLSKTFRLPNRKIILD